MRNKIRKIAESISAYPQCAPGFLGTLQGVSCKMILDIECLVKKTFNRNSYMKKKPSEKIISILNKHFDKLNKIAIGEVNKKQLIDDIKNDLDYDKNKLSDIYLLNLAIQPYATGLRVDLNKKAFKILVSGLNIPPYYTIPKNNIFMTDAAKCGYYDKVEVLIPPKIFYYFLIYAI